jgi:hypothetical protein
MALTRINNQALTNVTSAGLPSGSVVQVVSSSNSTNTTLSHTSYADRHTASITPKSSSNKVLVIVNYDIYHGGTGQNRTEWRILDHDGTEALDSFFNGRSETAVVYKGGTTGANFLSSPATTSAVTYKVQDKMVNGSSSFRSCTITLMEIAG